MIQFTSHTLKNGLKILIHPDNTSDLIAVNLIYQVGARDEQADKTGFAHLFEHLMFGGSIHIPEYDTPLQLASGENNAFTNNDYTNYYLTLPHQNLETAFWLESDRMLQLDFSERNLAIQKKVVIEEFNQRYLNQPYGDIWLLLRSLAYKVHPYQWAAIGKETAHVANASLDDVQSFFGNFYRPNNCILSLSGKVDPDKGFRLAQKWFEDIPSHPVIRQAYPAEPVQQQERRLAVLREVPDSVIYLAFHMGSRTDREYYLADMLSDILSNGPSSRLIRRYIKEEQIFTEVNAFITGDLDPGLFILTAKPIPGVSLETAENSLWTEIGKLINEPISEKELSKVRNKIEANQTYLQTQLLNKAMLMGYFGMLGNAEEMNNELDKYFSCTAEELQGFAAKIFNKRNTTVLYYKAK